jgi:hypothetical protein
LDGGYITYYTYTCNTTTNTYTLTIPRSDLTESLHGTTSEMKHTVVLSLLNNIKVHVVTHVKVQYRPIEVLSDDVVSV